MKSYRYQSASERTLQVFGGQAGADPQRVLAAMATPGMAITSLTLTPGDVAFTHSNLLHCSLPNESERWRRNIIIAYNSRWCLYPGVGYLFSL